MAYRINIDVDGSGKLKLMMQYHINVPWTYDKSQINHEKERIERQRIAKELTYQPETSIQKSQSEDEFQP